jgi:hypothetical protein
MKNSARPSPRFDALSKPVHSKEFWSILEQPSPAVQTVRGASARWCRSGDLLVRESSGADRDWAIACGQPSSHQYYPSETQPRGDRVRESVHNYISEKDQVVRKGAISAHDGEEVVIPLNMADGMIFGTGKGSTAYNRSAPHGRPPA